MRATIIGAGAFGTAVADVLACTNKISVVLGVWSGDEEKHKLATTINQKHRNPIWVKGSHSLNPEIRAVSSFEKALAQETDMVFWAVPTKYFGNVVAGLSNIPKNVPHVILSKGFVVLGDEAFLPAEIIKQALGPAPPRYKVSAVGGPSFATDLLAQTPSAVVAGGSIRGLTSLATLLYDSESPLQIDLTDDQIGVGLCAALKTAYAIGGGIVASFGENLCAIYIVRVLEEMRKFVQMFGGRSQTVSGLAGLGDFLLTATSKESRNFRFGELLRAGLVWEDALNTMKVDPKSNDMPAVEGFSVLQTVPLFIGRYQDFHNQIKTMAFLQINFPILEALANMATSLQPSINVEQFIAIIRRAKN